MLYAFYAISAILAIGLIVLFLAYREKAKNAEDINRQFNELRATYQKMEYKISTQEQEINKLNTTNKSLQDELTTLMDNPMVNKDKINKRIGK